MPGAMRPWSLLEVIKVTGMDGHIAPGVYLREAAVHWSQIRGGGQGAARQYDCFNGGIAGRFVGF